MVAWSVSVDLLLSATPITISALPVRRASKIWNEAK